MPTYTLTPDLIEDVFKLIPQNLERLNKNTDLEFWMNKDDKPCFGYHGRNVEPEEFKVFVHCLRTIPDFQVENPKYIYDDKFWGFEIDDKNFYNQETLHKMAFRYGYEKAYKTKTFKTIASATLHGQAEFPPSTLEELCESYKILMSK